MVKKLIYPALTISVFLAVNHWLTDWFPSGYRNTMEVKRRHILDHGKEYDTLFLGSSRVCYGLDPATFDQAMKKAGGQTRSFNLAMDGVRHYEAIYLLEKLLENHRVPALKRVVLEVQRSGPFKIRDQNLFNARMVTWHDRARTRNVIRDMAVSDLKPTEFMYHSYVHVLHFGHRLSNLGKARIGFQDWLERKDRQTPTPKQIQNGLGPAGQGFASLDLVGNKKNREKYQAEPEEHQKVVDWIKVWHKRDMSRYGQLPLEAIEANQREDWLELDRLLKSHGIELILVVPPIMSPAPYVMKPLMQQDQIPYFIFNDPENYPELYQMDHRFDRAHLSEKGAELWTALLVEKILAGEAAP